MMTIRSCTASLVAALTALIAFAAASPASAFSLAPVGFQVMCLQHPKECQGGGSATVTLTAAVLGKITRVNAQVNDFIRPQNDRVGDVWTVGASAGDCEDYVLSKRRALIKAGLPASSLRIAYVKTWQGVDHAILIVKTDGADLVLDNLATSVMPLRETHYRVIAVSSADPLVWH